MTLRLEIKSLRQQCKLTLAGSAVTVILIDQVRHHVGKQGRKGNGRACFFARLWPAAAMCQIEQCTAIVKSGTNKPPLEADNDLESDRCPLFPPDSTRNNHGCKTGFPDSP